MMQLEIPAIKKHKKGDFPVTDLHTKKIITFPCDQHIKKNEMNYIIKTVNDFYFKSKTIKEISTTIGSTTEEKLVPSYNIVCSN